MTVSDGYGRLVAHQTSHCSYRNPRASRQKASNRSPAALESDMASRHRQRWGARRATRDGGDKARLGQGRTPSSHPVPLPRWACPVTAQSTPGLHQAYMVPMSLITHFDRAGGEGDPTETQNQALRGAATPGGPRAWGEGGGRLPAACWGLGARRGPARAGGRASSAGGRPAGRGRGAERRPPRYLSIARTA